MGWCSGAVQSPCFPIVLILFLESCSKIGLVKAMGILFGQVSESISMKSADLGIALGLFFAVGLFSAPIVASVITKITRPRLLLVLVATIGSSPIVLASLATSNLQLFIFFAISGTGYCILRITCMTALDKLAGEGFNLLFSLSTCGYSIGMVLIPFLAEELLIAYDWRGVLLILGGVMLHAIPCALAIRIAPEALVPRCDEGLQRFNQVDNDLNSGLPDKAVSDIEGHDFCSDAAMDSDHGRALKESERISLNLTPSEVQDREGDADQSSSTGVSAHKNHLAYISSIPRKILLWFRSTELYADPYSLFIFLSNGVLVIVYNGWHAFLVPHALQRGISQRNTIIITFVAAVGNLFIRLAIAFLTHRLVDPVNMHLLLTVFNIILLTCDAFIPNFYVMLVTSWWSAAAIAGRATLASLTIRNRISSEKITIAFSLNFFVESFGFFLGGYLSGLMADRFSSYDATFKLLAAFDVLTFIFMLLPKLVKKPNVS